MAAMRLGSLLKRTTAEATGHDVMRMTSLIRHVHMYIYMYHEIPRSKRATGYRILSSRYACLCVRFTSSQHTALSSLPGCRFQVKYKPHKSQYS